MSEAEHDSRLTQMGVRIDGLAKNMLEGNELLRATLKEMREQRAQGHGHLERIYTRLGELHELMLVVRMDTSNNSIVLADRLPVIEQSIKDLTEAIDSLGATQPRIDRIERDSQRAAGETT